VSAGRLQAGASTTAPPQVHGNRPCCAVRPEKHGPPAGGNLKFENRLLPLPHMSCAPRRGLWFGPLLWKALFGAFGGADLRVT
jgi:hypothetical protein